MFRLVVAFYKQPTAFYKQPTAWHALNTFIVQNFPEIACSRWHLFCERCCFFFCFRSCSMAITLRLEAMTKLGWRPLPVGAQAKRVTCRIMQSRTGTHDKKYQSRIQGWIHISPYLTCFPLPMIVSLYNVQTTVLAQGNSLVDEGGGIF